LARGRQGWTEFLRRLRQRQERLHLVDPDAGGGQRAPHPQRAVDAEDAQYRHLHEPDPHWLRGGEHLQRTFPQRPLRARPPPDHRDRLTWFGRSPLGSAETCSPPWKPPLPPATWNDANTCACGDDPIWTSSRRSTKGGPTTSSKIRSACATTGSRSKSITC